MSDMNIVWVDLETGGTDEAIHQITQIAAIATEGPPLFNELDWMETKVQLVKGHYTQEALDLHGYDSDLWMEEAEPIELALGNLESFARKFCHQRISKRTGRPYDVAHMAGHNVEFDGRFLRAACERNKAWMPLTNWTGGQFDTLPLAKWWFMKQGQYPETFTLEHLCELFGIPLDAHDAKNDIEATIELARRMMK